MLCYIYRFHEKKNSGFLCKLFSTISMKMRHMSQCFENGKFGATVDKYVSGNVFKICHTFEISSFLFYILRSVFCTFFRNLESFNDIVGKSTLLHPHQFLKYSMYISSIHKKWFLWSCKKFQNSRKTDPSFSRFGNSERSCDKTTTTFLKIQLTR